MDERQEAEVRAALSAGATAHADEYEAGAAYWDEQANFLEAMGDRAGADSLRSVNDYGREHVIAPLRKAAEE